jgi:predicted ATPase
MYVRRIEITNIRVIHRIVWQIAEPQLAAGWHVIVGDNGAGKSSFLRAVALALLGPESAQQLRQPWDQWLAKGKKSGQISVGVQGNPTLDRFSGRGKTADTDELLAVVNFSRQDGDGVALRGQKAERHVWGKGDGWFSASYGPFRRFTGGDPESRRLFYQFPRLGRHLSLFGEEVALTECLEWLRELRFKQLEQAPEGRLLDRIKAFVNQEGFLPFQARLEEVTSSAVQFIDGNGATVEVENLSDGYRSILSMTFELIRQLALVYGADAVFDPLNTMKVNAPGVVLIDEIDAHLHPTWQRRIGFWFREHFPKMQFIVSSHSPLVCQAADPGTIFRLPRPGYDEEGYMVTGDEYRRLVYGNVLDAYGTEVFGESVTSSDRSRGLRERLAELNVKEIRDGLTEEERTEQLRLRQTLPTEAGTLEPHRAENP